MHDRPPGVAEAGALAEACRPLPPIERLQVVDIQPGDYVIATIAERAFDWGEVKALGDDLRTRFPDQHVLVVTGVDLDVMRPVHHTTPEPPDA